MLYQTLLIAFAYISGVQGAGYNETNPYTLGIERFAGSSQGDWTYGPLTFSGLLFGRNDAGGSTLSQWGSGWTCGFNNTEYSGTDCIKLAIHAGTFAAANGVVKNGGNLVNIVTIRQQNGGNAAAYSAEDIGQGPSCSTDTDNAYGPSAQANNCTNLASASPPTARFTFPTRGFKVTCKNVCGPRDRYLETNFLRGISMMGQAMLDGNFYAARFAIVRAGSPSYVTARCRLSFPHLNRFGMDLCPDSIPAWGSTVTADDYTPR